MLVLAILLAIFNIVNLISLSYYLFGLVYVLNRLEFRQQWIESAFNSIILICFITILFDLVGFKLVDFLTTYERRLMVDNRITLPFPRPTSFFREPSALGLLLGVLYSVGLAHNLKIHYKLLLICGVLSLSFSFYLLLIFALLFYSNIRFKFTKTVSIMALIFIIFKVRIYQVVQIFYTSGPALVELNLSVVKRYVQPLYAMYEYVHDSSLYHTFFGYGPGGYKLYLQSKYAYIVGSDLGVGYLLNIFGNYMMSFGLLYAVLFLLFLWKKYTFKEFLLILLLCFQGVAVVHPVFLLAALKIKK